MHRPTAISLLVLASLAAAPRLRAQDDAPAFPAAAVPARGARVAAFVPRGWAAAAEVSGDLNGDGRPDRVVHLVPQGTHYRPESITAAPESQALLILLADGGGYRRAGLATHLLQEIVPQWGLQMSIRRGVLITEQNYGMTEVMDVTHRFRLDPANGRFLLIGCDRFFYTRPQEAADSRKVSENYLTGVRLTTVGHFDDAGRYSEREQREQIPRTKTYFDDIVEDDEG